VSKDITDSVPMGVVLHVPHHSTMIPSSVRDQFLLQSSELMHEVVRMTDHLTLPLFAGESKSGQIVVAPVSRLVVDVERFPEDGDEPMSERGMGVIYTSTADGFPLRRPISQAERQRLLADYYLPHHAKLSAAVGASLERTGQCLIIDAHSFPSQPLPYELDQDTERPEVCIGTDPFHTPVFARQAFVAGFEAQGFAVAVDRPFAGALVPADFYRKDSRVLSVMVEINRGLYLDELSAVPLPSFPHIAARIQAAVQYAHERIHEEMAG
jgi:N-formylglutamate deformylase